MCRFILLSVLAVSVIGSAAAQHVPGSFTAAIPAELATWNAEPATDNPPVAAVTIETRLRDLRTFIPGSRVLLVRQLSTQLRSRNAAEREKTLKDIILYAASYGDLVDLSGLTPDLFRVFATDPNPAHRIMVVHAIGLLGDDQANRWLLEMAARDRSPQVRRMAMLSAMSVINGITER
jgi:hypothetical protein